MSIYFNVSKDSAKPNTLAVKLDRVIEKDTIHLTEVMWAMTETKISFVGILGADSQGIENYDDKSWKPGGQKVSFSFLRDENPVWNKDTRQTTMEPAGDEQKMVFGVLSDALNKLIATGVTCASAVMKPAASGILLQLYRSEDPAQKAMLPTFTTSMFVFTPTGMSELTTADEDFVKALVAQKPGDFKKFGSGTGNYVPKQSESDRLNARWAFIQNQFKGVVGGGLCTDLPELMSIINAGTEAEIATHKAALAMLIQIITK